MTLKVKKDGAWKEASSLKVKINGGWKDVSTLYSKKDGAWVTVYSSGALITFTNYPYPIPVAKGWKYSTDKVNWTTVSSDSTINTSGTFTGYVKAKGILTLSGFYTDHISAASNVVSAGQRLGTGRSHSSTFVNKSYGFVCGGSTNFGNGINGNDFGISSAVDRYDSSGNRSYASSLSVARMLPNAFVNNSKGYVCGGYSLIYYADEGNTVTQAYNTVDVYDSYGSRTTGTPLSEVKYLHAAFTAGSLGVVCGGTNSKGISNVVNLYDSSGNMTISTNTLVGGARNYIDSFSLGNIGFACGGRHSSGGGQVTMFDSSGNQTAVDPLSYYRYDSRSYVVSNKGYVCGGLSRSTGRANSYIDSYNSSGVKTSVGNLNYTMASHTALSCNNKGYICGGTEGSMGTDPSYYLNYVEIRNSSGVNTGSASLGYGRCFLSSFSINNKGYVCGGLRYSGGYISENYVDVIYDRPEQWVSKIPITAGSTYTLNGTTAMATSSKILSYNSKVSGTIKYKTGTVPSS